MPPPPPRFPPLSSSFRFTTSSLPRSLTVKLRASNGSTTISPVLGNPMTPVIYVAAILAIFILGFVSWWYWCRKKKPDPRSAEGGQPKTEGSSPGGEQCPKQNPNPVSVQQGPARSQRVSQRTSVAVPQVSTSARQNLTKSENGMDDEEEGENLVRPGPDPEIGKSAPIVALPSLPSMGKSADGIELNGIASSRYPTIGRPSSRGLPTSVGAVASGALMARCRANKQLFEEAKKQKKVWATPKGQLSYTSSITSKLKPNSDGKSKDKHHGSGIPKSNISNIGSKGLKFNWTKVLEVSHAEGAVKPGQAPNSTISNARHKPKKIKSPQIDPASAIDKAHSKDHHGHKNRSKSKSRSKSKNRNKSAAGGAGLKQKPSAQPSLQPPPTKSRSKSKSKSKSKAAAQSKSKTKSKTRSNSKTKSKSKTAQSKSKSKTKNKTKSGIKADPSNSQGQVHGKRSKSKSKSKVKPTNSRNRPAMSTLLNKNNQPLKSTRLAVLKDIVTK